MSEIRNQIIICVLGYDCCKRWAYVRDYYIRRKGKPGTGSGGEAAKNRSVILSFLDSIPSSQRQNTITNVVGDEVRFDESEFLENSRRKHHPDWWNRQNMIIINSKEGNNKKIKDANFVIDR